MSFTVQTLLLILLYFKSVVLLISDKWQLNPADARNKAKTTVNELEGSARVLIKHRAVGDKVFHLNDDNRKRLYRRAKGHGNFIMHHEPIR